MRRLLHLAAVAALVALAPATVAQDQVSQTATSVIAEPFEGRLAPGAAYTTPVRVEYNYPAHGGAAQGDTRITLTAPALPDWAAATVEPSELMVTPELGASSGSGTAVGHANLTVTIAEDAPRDIEDAVTVRAEAEENPPLASSQGETSIPLTTAPVELPTNATDRNATSNAADDAGGNGVPGPALGLALAATSLAAAVRRGGRPPRGSPRRGPSR